MKVSRLFALAFALALPVRAVVISYTYDAAGRLTSAGFGGVSSTTYRYDANGNLLALTNSQSLFVPLAGSYAGLIAANPVSNAGAGFITLNVTLTGGFTGQLSIGGKLFKLKDTFDPNGEATLDLPLVPPVQLALHIDPATHEITGTLSGGVTASLTAFAAPFGKKSPAPGGAVGKFTGLFEATESVATKPKGSGFGTLTIGSTGSVKLAATLADGTKVSQGTTLVSGARWALFAPLYKGGGFVGGLVEYAPAPGESDFDGPLDWLKPQTPTPLYGDPFATHLVFTAARYTPPAKGRRALDLADITPNGRFVAPGVSRSFTLDSKGVIRVADPNPEHLTLTLGVKAGMVSGSILFGGKTRKLSGLLQLQQNAGAGFFFSDSESLPFTLGRN